MQKTISNAFKNAPFGDEKYGLLGSVPDKILHVSGTGLLKHMWCDAPLGGQKTCKK